MTTTSAVNNNSTATTTDKSTLTSDFDDFLLLLTTQLQYQDPLDPMDASEFTNQLVQYSQVEQQIKSNDYLDKLTDLSKANETIKALGYVGLQIQNEGNTFAFSKGYTVTMNYVIPEDAYNGTIVITDAEGNKIYSEAITEKNLAEGTHSFTWDGKDAEGDEVEAGTYKISVSAFDADKKALTTKTIVPGYVTGITKGEDGTVKLIVNGEEVDIDDVTKATL